MAHMHESLEVERRNEMWELIGPNLDEEEHLRLADILRGVERAEAATQTDPLQEGWPRVLSDFLELEGGARVKMFKMVSQEEQLTNPNPHLKP